MKKLMCLLLVAVFLFVPVTAFALDGEQMAAEPLNVQLQKILDSPTMTTYQKELAQEKYDFLMAYREHNVLPGMRTDYYCFISVAQYTQEAGNWCGPATIY